MKFTKTNIETTKGRQPSKYDSLLSEFTEEGDAIQFDEKSEGAPDGISRQTGAQIASRLKLISGKPFHSFFDHLNKKVTVRLRKEGEIEEKEGEGDGPYSE